MELVKWRDFIEPSHFTLTELASCTVIYRSVEHVTLETRVDCVSSSHKQGIIQTVPWALQR